MKGLVRAALEKVRCIELENIGLRGSKELCKMEFKPRYFESLLSSFTGGSVQTDDEELKSTILTLLEELNQSREENLIMGRCAAERGVKGGFTVQHRHEDLELKAQYLKSIEEAKHFLPTISKLQAQIQAMEFEWTQAKSMRDELFDYDDKLREHQMVADSMFLKRCSASADVKIYATSRRQMLEILVEDRNRNINGHYARRIIPLERLRVEKDAQISELNLLVRKLECQCGVSSVEMKHTVYPAILTEICASETRLQSLNQAGEAAEEKLDALQRVVRNFEDRANEWKTAHDQASCVISKAEHLRAEYDGMMAKLREEDNRLLAKKRVFAKKQAASACDVEGQHTRFQEISEEVESMEGEIAEKEHSLKRLNEKMVIMEKKLSAEKKAVGLLELEINGVTLHRVDFEAFLEHRRGGGEKFIVEDGGEEASSKRLCVVSEEDDSLTEGFSGVCV